MAIGTEQRIEWLHSLEEGLERAKSSAKPVLLDFFNPG
jgi:hypothetical protein